MDSDIILEGNLVVVQATDLLLDAGSERRSSEGTSEYRRALVHGEGDSLILNFNRDYPGGISLMGKVHLADLEAPAPSSGGPSIPKNIPGGWKGGIDLPHFDLMAEPDIAKLFEGAHRADLIATIKALRSAVLSLDRRVKALESK